MSEPGAWARSFTQATNEDAEIGAHGEYYSCSFMWDMGDRKVLVDMHKGKVERINLDPQPLDAYQFAPRAPRERGAELWPERCTPSGWPHALAATGSLPSTALK
jgi:hypothetical protein